MTMIEDDDDEDDEDDEDEDDDRYDWDLEDDNRKMVIIGVSSCSDSCVVSDLVLCRSWTETRGNERICHRQTGSRG